MNNKLLKNSLIFALLLVISLVALFSSSTEATSSQRDLSASFTPEGIASVLPEKPQTLADMQALLSESSTNCQLPCFWGIISDYSTGKDVIALLKPSVDYSHAAAYYDVEFNFKENQQEDPIFYLSFGVKDNIVSSAYVDIERPAKWLPQQTYELPYLLSQSSSQPYVYLSINETRRQIFLTLIYKDGIFAEYAFELRLAHGNTIDPKVDNPFMLCPSLDLNDSIVLRLQADNADTLLRVNNIPLLVSRNKTWPVQHMTGMTAEKFTKQIIEHPDQCIELPSYPELVKMGYVF